MSESHWYQNSITNRFQEYVISWGASDKKTNVLIPIDTIDKVPISMFVGTADGTCPYETALETKDTIGAAVVSFDTFEGEGHGFFGSANKPDFMALLYKQLQVPAETKAEVLQ